MEFEKLLEQLKDIDLEEYQKIIDFCATRKSGTEGIPAIIGLDDLTEADNTKTVYELSPMDERMKMQMALDALVFTHLYSQDKNKDEFYPAVASAMSALAEKDFILYDDEEEPTSYRSMLDGNK